MKTLLLIGATALFCSVACMSQQRSTTVYDVREYGAKGDGITLDTKAIQRAIDDCGSTGGVVVFARGTFLTGSLELKSNTELRIESGATILGSKNLSDYAEHVPRLKSYNNIFLKYSLLYAEGQSNISITGRGTIDGQGSAFKVVSNEKPERYKNRPYGIRFIECKNVLVENITLRNSAMWMQHYLACEGVTIRGVRVFNHANKNNDMMDIDGCKNVIVSDCTGDTDDDGITLKSTSDRITEDVSIANCVISSHCNAIKTGTESTGGFKNIAISNIVIVPSSVETVMSGQPGGTSGISLTLVDGGVMDGISISNVVMDGPAVPIFVRLGNRARKYWEGAPVPGVGLVKNVVISHVTAHHVKTTGCSITGIEGHAIEGISLNDIRLEFAGGITESSNKEVQELADQYPEATMWGTLPSYGFYIRHVSGLQIHNLILDFDREDVRPAMILDDVVDAKIDGLDAKIWKGGGSALVLENVRGLMLSGSSLRGKANALLKLIGDKNERISVGWNDLRVVKQVCDPLSALGNSVYSFENQMSH